MKDDKKYVVYWIDNINLCVVEVSSSLANAKIVKSVTDTQNIEKANIEKFDDFIDSLKSLRRCREENWKDFSPSALQVQNAKVDKYYDLIIEAITKKCDGMMLLPSI